MPFCPPWLWWSQGLRNTESDSLETHAKKGYHTIVLLHLQSRLQMAKVQDSASTTPTVLLPTEEAFFYSKKKPSAPRHRLLTKPSSCSELRQPVDHFPWIDLFWRRPPQSPGANIFGAYPRRPPNSIGNKSRKFELRTCPWVPNSGWWNASGTLELSLRL